jgi:Pentapeptide repeats (8 copies)
VDDEQQARAQSTRTRLLWAGIIATLAFLTIVLCGYLLGWKGTGFPGRTVWDWLDLLIVPVVLAIGGYLFTRSENRATRAAADQRAQDEALQAYLDHIGQLLLDKERPLRQSRGGNEVRSLARARTLTVLARLDGDRKGSALQFLYESNLITKATSIVDLKGANLREAELSRVNLSMADLSGADLSDANLLRTDLSGANLSGANLSGTNLSDEQLAAAMSIEDATMPDGQILQGAAVPEGPTFGEWLEGKGREEDEKNE